MRTFISLLLALLLAGCASAPAPAPETIDLLIRSASVIDVRTGQVTPDQTIAVRGGDIVAVLPNREADRYQAARTWDAQGQYVMPGLWDMHVHFGGGEALAAENAELMPLYVVNGVVAVRDAAGDLAQQVLDWRDNPPTPDSPRIFTSGPKIEGIAPVWKGVIETGSEADVDAALDRLQAMRVDFIKITDNTLKPELFLYAVREAKKRGIKTSAHIPMSLTVLEAAEAGLSSIEHLDYAMKAGSRDEAAIAADYLAGRFTYAQTMKRYADTFDIEVARRTYARLAELGVAVTPTLYGSTVLTYLDRDDHSHDPELAYVGPGIRATYDWRIQRAAQATPEMIAARHYVEEVTSRTLPLLRDAGVTILAGTDAGFLNSFNYPGFSLHEELALYVRLGLTPREALKASVVDGPQFLGQGERYGAVEAGKAADLLILVRNPLEDITATRDIAGVVLRGRLLDRATLTRMQDSIRERVRGREAAAAQ
ncbi:amidohydrolase family protein [Brevundimonas lenta]|uniref:Imidazolonepropionase-like amidohydrolase n=1 Tax=Brevundimonas lenta TaxID=424796 RepID=A0A7W6JEC0_9CAUL|nr:amidohydrolase family protein [Brevundimonas lenta]MBB4083541.1 imidazolonepropionase-like amidohydrolase [Brevundimonas lenta]